MKVRNAMYNDLPEFVKTKMSYARNYINEVLTGAGGPSLVRLEEYDDHHFRATFKMSYFQLAEGAKEPSKSQWSTLKKKLKRRNRLVFVFREYGTVQCDPEVDEPTKQCYYIDFGFMYE